MAAEKTTRKKTMSRSAKTTETRSKTPKATKEQTAPAAVQSVGGDAGYPVRVPAGGIDQRLIEARDRQREEERGVAAATAAEPARLDPRLAGIRDRTKARERELAGRSLTEPPALERREA